MGSEPGTDDANTTDTTTDNTTDTTTDNTTDNTTADTAVRPSEVGRGDLIRWSEALSGIARTGLAFSSVLYERERYEEILAVAADMRHVAGHDLEPNHLHSEWLKLVGSGVPGYVTPKVAIGAVVGNEDGELLLIQRSDSGHWLYPTGWADIGYSPAEVAAKEVFEETGILCEPMRVLSVLDGLRRGFTQIPLYSIVFYCRAIGGELNPHPLEVRDAGWFREDALPEPLAGGALWSEHAFQAIRGEAVHATFDDVRSPVWRGDAGAH